MTVEQGRETLRPRMLALLGLGLAVMAAAGDRFRRVRAIRRPGSRKLGGGRIVVRYPVILPYVSSTACGATRESDPVGDRHSVRLLYDGAISVRQDLARCCPRETTCAAWRWKPSRDQVGVHRTRLALGADRGEGAAGGLYLPRLTLGPTAPIRPPPESALLSEGRERRVGRSRSAFGLRGWFRLHAGNRVVQ